MTPGLASSFHNDEGIALPNGIASGIESETSNGTGNLADELAGAFDEDEEVDAGVEVPKVQYNGTEDGVTYEHQLLENQLSTSSPSKPYKERSLSPPKQPMRSKHHHRHNSKYDGSDYGDDDDLEGLDGIPPSLEARMAAIEGLARRGTEANGSDLDGVTQRVAQHLKNLGPQSNIENGASRLITTHTAQTSYLANQTRTLSTLIHPLLSPFSTPPDPAFLDDILPLLTALISEIPTPTSLPLSSLLSLHASTAEITAMLTYLTDTLHMSRQTSSLASRRLRSAIEVVVEMRRELDAKEEAMRCLEKGDWEKRLAGRECARFCGNIIGGFQEVCDGWRKTLAGGLEVGAA